MNEEAYNETQFFREVKLSYVNETRLIKSFSVLIVYLELFSSRVQNETITMDNPNVDVLSSMLTLDFMPTFIPQQYVGAARCDETKSASGLSACDIFQCVVYDPPGLSRPGYDDSVSV